MTTEKTMEKVKEKIRKCLALAEGAKTEGEAHAAAMMAQRLLAKHHLEEDEVKDAGRTGETVIHKSIECKNGFGPGQWRYWLASGIADNFRCKIYSRVYSKMKMREIVLMGLKEDCDAAVQVYESMAACAPGLFRRWNKERRQAEKRIEEHKDLVNGFIREHALALGEDPRCYVNCGNLRAGAPLSEIIKTEASLARRRRERGESLVAQFSIPKAWIDEEEALSRGSETSIKNGWYRGFACGVEKALDEQRETDEEMAICLRIPAIVKTEYSKMTFAAGRRGGRGCSTDKTAYSAGEKAGRACGSRRGIAA